MQLGIGSRIFRKGDLAPIMKAKRPSETKYWFLMVFLTCPVWLPALFIVFLLGYCMSPISYPRTETEADIAGLHFVFPLEYGILPDLLRRGFEASEMFSGRHLALLPGDCENAALNRRGYKT